MDNPDVCDADLLKWSVCLQLSSLFASVVKGRVWYKGGRLPVPIKKKLQKWLSLYPDRCATTRTAVLKLC